MKSKTIRWLGIVLLVSIPVLVITAAGSALDGAAFISFNSHVDSASENLCNRTDANCNRVQSKEFVWLNGGLNSNVFETDGVYFFAVLEPGEQPNPNDQGGIRDANLSDDYDCYQNRIFTVKNGSLSTYTGDIDCSEAGYTDYALFSHWLDSGKNEPRSGNMKPNEQPPLLRVFPYSDTTDPAGAYLLAVCSLEDGYPVDPRRCKFDAFQVKPSDAILYSFFLDGYKVEDLIADGYDEFDIGLEGWQISISGTGPDGLPIKAQVTTTENGYWSFNSGIYTFAENEKPQDVTLTVCEQSQEGWTQSFPDGKGCHQVTFTPTSFERFLGLNFADWRTISLTACAVQDGDGELGGEAVPLEGWKISLNKDGSKMGSQRSGSDGCATWTDLSAGSSYDVHVDMKTGWRALAPTDMAFLSNEAYSGTHLTYTFVNAPLQGCASSFWQDWDETGNGSGQGLWDGMPDPDWTGQGVQPFAAGTNFCQFFGGCIGDKDMLYYVADQPSGEVDKPFNKAAHSLVAAYLNASWGMNYAYSPTQLKMKWAAAIETEEQLLALADELNTANQAFGRSDSAPTCPIGLSMK